MPIVLGNQAPYPIREELRRPMTLAILDVDGTLTQTMGLTDSLFFSVVADVLGNDGFSRDTLDYPHVTDSGLVSHIFSTHLGRDATANEIAEIKTRYMANLRRACPAAEPVPGAREAMAHFSESPDWGLSIATGNWLVAAQHKLAACGLVTSGVPMATADDSPDRREILWRSRQRAGEYRDVVYFGDREWDRKAARAAGFAFVAMGDAVVDPAHALPDWTDLDAVEHTAREALRSG